MNAITELRCFKSRVSFSSGVALSEFVIALPAFLLLGLGALQSLLFYQAKTVVDYAAFEAARKGATTHAQRATMLDEFGLRLAPLFGGDGSVEKGLLAIGKGRIEANITSITRLDIISPSAAAFSDFAESNSKTGQLEIPNDHLKYRDTKALGAASGINIQDANLLNIEATYGFKLKVPFISGVLTSALMRLDAANAAFYRNGRIPIKTSATVRMQSAAWQQAAAVEPAPEVTSNSNNTQGQGGNGTAVDPFAGPNASGNCDPSRQSCLDNGLNQGNPNACTASSIKDGSGQTASSANLPALSVGNPIHIGSGNKYQLEHDLAMPTVRGATLHWQRHYNSRSHLRAGLGHGWTHSYSVRALKTERGIRLRQADGREILYETRHGEKYLSGFNSDGWIELSSATDAGASDTIRWHRSSGEVLLFNAQGRLSQIKLVAQASISLQYNDKGNLLIVRDSNNRQFVLAYYPNGQVKTVKSSEGQRVDYRYDNKGNLKLALRDGTFKRRYHYEDTSDANNLTGITNAEDIRYATWAYDEADRAILSEHAGGVQRVSVDYSNDNERSVTNSKGQISHYVIGHTDGLAYVKSITGPGCGSCSASNVRYEYNQALQLTAQHNKSGERWWRLYDDLGRLSAIYRQQQSGKETLVTAFSFKDNQRNPNSFSRPSVNPLGQHVVSLTRNDNGQINSITEKGWTPDFNGSYSPMQRTSRYEYQDGQLLVSDGPVPGDSDRMQYPVQKSYKQHPAQASKTSESIALLGSDLRLRYVAAQQQAVIEQASGESYATLQYDKLGRIKRFKGPSGEASVQYDGAGRVQYLIGTYGIKRKFKWSLQNTLLGFGYIDKQGEYIAQQRNGYQDGKLVEQYRQYVGSANYVYDIFGRVDSISDAQSRQTQYAYNDQGLLANVTKFSGTPDKASTGLSYDVHGNVTGIRDPRGNQSLRAYDDFGHLLYKSNPDKGVTLYRYDAAGNVIARVDENAVINRFHYDNKNRLIGMGPANTAPTSTFSFDKLGRENGRNSLRDKQTIEYSGKIKTITTRLKALGKGYSTKRESTVNGSIETLPNGHKLTISRTDNRQALTLNGEQIAEIELDKRGRPIEKHFASGYTESYHYKNSGELKRSQWLKQRNQISETVYSYSAPSQISSIIKQGSANSNSTATYNYDVAGRLIAVDIDGQLEAWRYDSNGNRMLLEQGAKKTAYSTQAYNNHYKNIDGRHQQTANTGELLSDARLTYRYNVGHRLSAVYKGKQKIAAYQFNSEGQRIKKSRYMDGQWHSKYFLYRDAKLLAELAEDGDIEREYIYQGHKLLGFVEQNEFYATRLDHRGAPIEVYSPEGTLVWRASYTAFGLAHIEKEDISLHIRLPGQYYDTESGKHYNYFRTYDPENGRYLTSDPIGLDAGLNTMAYVMNDPLNRVDRLGLYDEMVHYYMTYFLAVVAGVPQDQALIMAQATQYIDKNPRTSPLPNFSSILWQGLYGVGKDLHSKLEKYHFVLDYENGDKGDLLQRKPGETDEQYILRRVQNPQSEQLDRLRDASMHYSDICRTDGRATSQDTKAQLYGEYLHAYEDTFAHRDQNNKPYSIFGNSDNYPSTLIGHIHLLNPLGLKSHYPDKTYNNISFIDVPQENAGFKTSFENQWAYNEARTLQMEKEIFLKLRRDFDVSSDITWTMLAGDGDANIGAQNYGDDESRWANGIVPVFKPSEGVQGVLQQFNAYNEDGHPDGRDAGVAAKVRILNAFLKNAKLGTIPEYKEEMSVSADNRMAILGGLPLGEGLIEESE